MKKLISLLLIAAVISPLFAFGARGAGCGDLSAECAALMCVQTGRLLYEKNAHTRHAMASTTKIMTSLIALEQHTPQRKVKVRASSLGVEGTSLGLAAGDIITLESLVYGMMLESGNDAANVTACAVAGSSEKFAALMNERAERIGMKDTNFVTPSGLDDENHYSTAYDMALLGCCAVKNPEFLHICSRKKAEIYFGSPPRSVTVYNHNKLLSYYPDAVGIKTGFTKKSGRCLVSCAQKDGVMLVAVTLNAPGDWADHKKMLDYGFSIVKPKQKSFDGITIPVAGGTAGSVKVHGEDILPSGEEINIIIYTEKFLYAPVKKGVIAGEARCYCGGRMIKSIPLLCDNDVDIMAGNAHEKAKPKGLFDIFRRN